jgi:hypothetical protein
MAAIVPSAADPISGCCMRSKETYAVRFRRSSRSEIESADVVIALPGERAVPERLWSRVSPEGAERREAATCVWRYRVSSSLGDLVTVGACAIIDGALHLVKISTSRCRP